MSHKIIDRLTKVAGWIRRNRHITLASSPECVKVNLGCGLDVAPNWINIDGSINALVANMPAAFHNIAYRLSGARRFYDEEIYCSKLQNNRFVHHDLSFGIPLGTNTVDYIYSSHFLEHLDSVTGEMLLKESLRVLKPNRTIRICVPDLEYAWELYKQGYKKRMLHDYFFIDGATGFSQHRYLYDYEMLSQLMEQIGFTNVRRAEFQRGSVPDLEVLDNRAEYTLFVEGEKPNL